MTLLPTCTRAAALTFTLLTFAAAAQAPEDVRVALVIGNSAYPNSPLVNPANDAAAMSGTLRQLGFNVVEVRDASLSQMTQAVDGLRARLGGKRGIGMLYYAGHGLQAEFRNYMVPVDAHLGKASDLPRQAVDVSVVIDAFKLAGNRLNIVVLDACRDNPFGEQSTGKGLAPMDAPPGTFLAYATAPGNVAEDGDAITGNGLYTSFLIKELQKPATRIEDVFKRVRLQVRQSSKGRQVPWESTSLEDDFYFNDGVRYTFRAEDLKRIADAAHEREQALARDASQAKALELARAAEQERLQSLAQAQAQAREQEQLKSLDRERAREKAFAIEKADWDRVKDSTTPADLYAFLQKYPSGQISELATSRLERLDKSSVKAQPLPGTVVQDAGAERLIKGDRIQYVNRDVLTGLVQGRVTREVLKVANDVADISGEGFTIQSTQGGASISDSSGSFDPPLTYYPASDLQAGKRWSARSQFVSRRDGWRGWVDVEGRVVARERIKLAFGEVDTFRMEITMTYQSGVREKRTVWVEPGWGMPLKVSYEVRNRSNQVNLWMVEAESRRRGG